ncbi:MAG: DUF5056 domain-containing protein [Bacteroidales bacterium]|jgi:hypothetical protein|nr:DUF5056 domain-containing protein [Bacteroidales bacterium]
MEREYFLPKEIIDSEKKSTLDDDFSRKVMSSLPQEERTPLWHYIIYVFAFALACFLCHIFGVKLSLDIINDASSHFFSFLESLFTDIKFYIVSTLLFLVVIIGLIRNDSLLQAITGEDDNL